MLKVTNLRREFRGGDGSTITAVNDANFAVADGVFASVIGKSGAGKSTMLGLLGALDRPTSGSIEVAGKNIEKLRGAALDDDPAPAGIDPDLAQTLLGQQGLDGDRRAFGDLYRVQDRSRCQRSAG